jgi:superfamily II DNA or RNA helicase
MYAPEAHTNEFRPHQIPVFEDVTAFMHGSAEDEFGSRSGYVTMPTGSGKSVIFSKLIASLQDTDAGHRTLLLTPNVDLLHNTVGEATNVGLSRFAPGVEVGTYFQHNKDLSKPVTVMTYDSFNILRANGGLPDDFCSLFICDEAHHTLGEVTKRNVNAFKQGKTAIGFTATPNYGEDKQLRSVFRTKIHEIDTREAIETGILAPFQYFAYKTDYNIDLDIHERQRFTPKELQRLADIEARNRAGVQFARALIQQGVGTLISCLPGEETKHATVVAEMLGDERIETAKGHEQVRVEAVNGEMHWRDRQELYGALASGEVHALTFVDVIREGLHIARAKGLINLRPTCSPVFSNQRRGRILGLTPERDLAIEVDFLDRTKKHQYTALHALGEFTYRRGKIFGQMPAGIEGNGFLVDLPEDLKQGITVFDAQKVSEIIINPDYIASHSEYVPVKSAIEQLGIPNDSFYPLASYLRIELLDYREAAGAKKGVMHVSEKDLEKVMKAVRTVQFRWLRDSASLPERQKFYDNLLAKRDKQDRQLRRRIVITDQPLPESQPQVDKYQEILDDETERLAWLENVSERLEKGETMTASDIQRTLWLSSKQIELDATLLDDAIESAWRLPPGACKQILQFSQRRGLIRSVGDSKFGRQSNWQAKVYLRLNDREERIVMGGKDADSVKEAERKAAARSVRFLIKHFGGTSSQ